MKLKALLLAGLIASPAPVFAQQTNTFQVCRQYQENYVPGYYNNNGNYIQGGVQTTELTVNCQTGEVYSSKVYNGNRGGYIAQPPVNYYRRRTCNPTAGALLGAGIASALSGGSGWNNSGSWNRFYDRNSSSGSWSNSYRNNNGWTLFGAGLGALLYSC
jgi:hypothetical protein